LRAVEVAALELGGIGWRQAEITLCGKGNRRHSLPLLTDAGEAVACWLAEGPPAERRLWRSRRAPAAAIPARAHRREREALPFIASEAYERILAAHKAAAGDG